MRGLMVLALLLGLLGGWFQPAWAMVNPTELGEAVTAIEQLDQMRVGLASTLEGRAQEPTLETFQQVCAPVGRRSKEIGQTHGWQVRQVALKYRNPNHRPQNTREEQALAEFQEHPDVQAFWQQDDQAVYYFRRIDVQTSCLACHGPKEARPAFVKNNYPQDLAYDFRVGDLRGMYEVVIPQKPAGS
ncbi:MAG: DUF3365 domain-containing protein [Gloeomargarita sp. GMQP_bins_120]